MFTKIMYVNLVIRDQDDALAFYTQLGFEKRIDYPRPEGQFLTLGFNGQDVEIILWKDITVSSLGISETKLALNPGFLFIDSTDLYEAYRVLASKSVTFETQAEDYLFGVRATVLGPDGNRVELRQRR